MGLLKQRLAALLKVPASPRYSKADKAHTDTAIGKLDALLPLRNELVHSPLEVISLRDDLHACFATVRPDGLPGAQLRAFSIDELRTTRASVEALVVELTAPGPGHCIAQIQTAR